MVSNGQCGLCGVYIRNDSVDWRPDIGIDCNEMNNPFCELINDDHELMALMTPQFFSVMQTGQPNCNKKMLYMDEM